MKPFFSKNVLILSFVTWIVASIFAPADFASEVILASNSEPFPWPSLEVSSPLLGLKKGITPVRYSFVGSIPSGVRGENPILGML